MCLKNAESANTKKMMTQLECVGENAKHGKYNGSMNNNKCKEKHKAPNENEIK